jgi:DNA polymerase-3 subunit epsilon
VATCPCAGQVDQATYTGIVGRVERGLTREPDLLLEPLRARMVALAGEARFEEAADMRERAAALASAIRRQRRLDTLRASGRLLVEIPGRAGAELRDGRLVRSWAITAAGDAAMPLPLDLDPDAPESAVEQLHLAGARLLDPLPKALADELSCVAAWLDREAGRVRVVHCEGGLASPFPPLPSFEPAAAAVSIKA